MPTQQCFKDSNLGGSWCQQHIAWTESNCSDSEDKIGETWEAPNHNFLFI